MDDYFSEEEDTRRPPRFGSQRHPSLHHRQPYQEPYDDPRYAPQTARYQTSYESYQEELPRGSREHSSRYHPSGYTHDSLPEHHHRHPESSNRHVDPYAGYYHQDPYTQHEPRDRYEDIHPRSYPRENPHPSQDHYEPEFETYSHSHQEQNYRRPRNADFQDDPSWTDSRIRSSSTKSFSNKESQYLYQTSEDLDTQFDHSPPKQPVTRNSQYEEHPAKSRPSSRHKQHPRCYEDPAADLSPVPYKKTRLAPNQKILNFTTFPIFFAPSCRNPFSGYSQVDAPRAQEILSTVKNTPFVEFEVLTLSYFF